MIDKKKLTKRNNKLQKTIVKRLPGYTGGTVVGHDKNKKENK